MKKPIAAQSEPLTPEASESRSFHEIAKKRFLRRYLHWLFIVLFGLLVYWEFGKEREYNRLKENLSVLATEAKNICVAKLDTACDDLKYIQLLVEEQILTRSNSDKTKLETVVGSFLHHKKAYDQIRYLDANGKEVLRANLVDSKPVLVSEENLQDKSNRPYYKTAIALKREEIYSSVLDLNQEHGKVEVPHKPVFRLAAPIFDQEGKAIGVVVVNMLAEELREECRYILAPGLPEDSLVYINLLPPDEKELMPPVAMKSRKPAANVASFPEMMRAHEPVSTASIPAHQVYSVGGRDKDKKTSDIFTIEVGIPSQVVQAAYRNLLVKILIIGGPLFIGLTWIFWLFAKAHAKEELLHVQVKHEAITDPLTGLYNRRYGYELLEQARSRAGRTMSGLSFFGVDINNLKKVNDTYGHKAGDELIVAIADALKAEVRSYDIVCRTGGDEFFVVLPDTDIEAGCRILARIHDKVQESGKGLFPPYGFSFSYGGVEELCGEYGDVDALIEAADTKMYHFKQSFKHRLLADVQI